MKVLITGGAGFIGSHTADRLLKEGYEVRVLDSLQKPIHNCIPKYLDNRIEFMAGNVTDTYSMKEALQGVDYVIHAAATKIVPTAEYNPFECIKTNVLGAMNLIDACIDQGVKKVVALSTDKASSPVNLYGATKLASDKVFVASNSSYSPQNTCFSAWPGSQLIKTDELNKMTDDIQRANSISRTSIRPKLQTSGRGGRKTL